MRILLLTFCIILFFHINPATSALPGFASNNIIKRGQVYSLVISLMNTGESQLKVLITEALKFLVSQQHSNFKSGEYRCQTGISCYDNDHDGLIDVLADYYKTFATSRGYSHLKVNAQHEPLNGKTLFTADIDPINP